MRLLADADLRPTIVRGLRRAEPSVAFLLAQGVIPKGTTDSHVLTIAANLDRVLVSHDLKTLPGHFYRFIELRESPGIILLPQLLPIGIAIEHLLIVWACQEAEEFKNRITYLPL